MSDQHKPPFVVPSQGGRFRQFRTGDAAGSSQQQPPAGPALDGDGLDGDGLDGDGGRPDDPAIPEGADDRRGDPLVRSHDRTGPAARELLEDRLAAAQARQAATGLATAVLRVEVDDLARQPRARAEDRAGEQSGEQGGAQAGERAGEQGGAQALLAALGHRLATALRSGDTTGCPEDVGFVVIAPEVPDEVALAALVRRIERVAAEPVEVGAVRVAVGVIVGGTLVGPRDTLTTALCRARTAVDVARRVRPGPSDVDLRETDLRETDLRETESRGGGSDRGHEGPDGETPAAERPA